MNSQEDVFGITEDRIVERLLDRLTEGVVPSNAAREREAEVRLHEYTELLGLIPYGLEPLAPPAGLREKLLRSVRAEEEPVDPIPVAKIVKVPVSRWVRTALPLAATLALVLAGVVGWQNLQLSEQTDTIQQLSQRLSQSNVDSSQLAQYERDLARMQEQLALVTSQGVEVCPLQPMAAAAAQTGARGALFVASDHQHWYLRIDDLEPCPQGNAYQLWFLTADGSAVDGGILDVRHGAELEVTSNTMPDGTVGVSITLEPAGGSAAPSGPSILYGDEVMRIL